MAAIGKIRSWGPVLVGVIGLALFAFIAEELVRSCNSGNQAEARRVATIYGEKIDYADYNQYVEDFKNYLEMTGQVQNVDDATLEQIWNNYLTNKLIAHEAEELGLSVTDEEIVKLYADGTNPLLQQFGGFFVNQQTGRFDNSMREKFLNDYKAGKFTNPQEKEQVDRLYNLWGFAEKMIRQQLLAAKYQQLLAHCFSANDVEAQMAFNERVNEAKIELAAFPYSSVKESEAKVSDADMSKKYDEIKERFRILEERRDLKYVHIQLTPSEADRNSVKNEVAKAGAALDSVADLAEVIRNAQSNIAYVGVHMLKTSYPQDIAQMLDSMAVGQTRGPIECLADGTFNAVKLISKQTMSDSILCRAIVIMDQDVEKAHTTADSIMTAINGGASFKDIAKKYNQTGDSLWVAGDRYPTLSNVQDEQISFINTLNSTEAGQTVNIKLATGNAIIRIDSKKAPQEKYLAAVVKRSILVSKDTRGTTFNKFSSFTAASKNGIADLEANAKKNGYKVEDYALFSTSDRNLPYVDDPRRATKLTRDAMKWVFEASEGDVSGVFECGNNRDEYIVIAVTKIYDDKYATLDCKTVKDIVKAECLKDKQAEVLCKKLNGVKTIAAAKQKGGIVSEIEQVTFDSPAAVGNTIEPAISGAVAATKAGQFVSHPVKGNDGVYVFQVKSKSTRGDKYDAKAYKSQLTMMYVQKAMNGAMFELYKNAGIKDNRYMMF